MSSKSIARFQAHRAGVEPPFDPRDTMRSIPTLPPPPEGAQEMIDHAKQLESLARKLKLRAAELRTAASAMQDRDLP